MEVSKIFLADIWAIFRDLGVIQESTLTAIYCPAFMNVSSFFLIPPKSAIMLKLLRKIW